MGIRIVKHAINLSVVSWIVFLLMLASNLVIAEASSNKDVNAQNPSVLKRNYSEPYSSGWSFTIDNDAFASPTRDRDYTSGFIFGFYGARAKEWAWSLDPFLDISEPLFFDSAGTKQIHHSQRVGLLTFTPDDLEATQPVLDDRPYSNLLFLSNSRQLIRGDYGPVDTSTFSLGILGLSIGGSLQRSLHDVFDIGETPRGWSNQISDGGEPTFLFSWSRQSLLSSNSNQDDGNAHEIKWSRELSLGYRTEASFSLAGRWGSLNSPWWGFSPERAESPSLLSTSQEQGAVQNEWYFWYGAKVRLRAYNAFLQGQFRDSLHTFEYDDIEPIIGEAWLGLTWEYTDKQRLSYVVRYKTPELKQGPGGRDFIWAGLMLNVSF